MPGSPEQVLVFQVNHLGDMVAMLPCLRGLREMLPHTRITLVTSAVGKDLLRNSNLADEVISMPLGEYRRLWRRPKDMLPLLHRLRRQGFGVSLSANDECSSSAILAWMAGIPIRIGFVSRAKADRLYTVRLRFDPRMHVAENRYQLLNALRSARYPDSTVPPIERIGIGFSNHEEELYESRLRPLLGKTFIAVHPFSKLAFRTWPAESFASFLAQFLRGHPDHRCALLTDGRDFPMPEDHARVVCLPRTTTRELAWVLREACLFVGNNSGPFHLACAMGTPAISITGPTQKHWWPMPLPGVRAVNLWADLPCSPCEDAGQTSCCPRGSAESECLERITVQQVMEATKSLLQTSQEPLRTCKVVAAPNHIGLSRREA